MSVRVVSLIGCLLLAGCDQFARVGASEPSLEPEPALSDAGDRDAAATDGGGDDGSAVCPSSTPAVCNPVTNQGCSATLSMQCAIDYAATLTGYCIYTAPPAMGMPGECLNTGITESCPGTFTCFAERCEKICLCDDDCVAGKCCSLPVEATGFRVCGDC